MNHSAPTTWLSSSEYPLFEELALMLRGESRSETTRKEAAEMLKAAKERD
jgi:DNA repair protein RecN (Recombination protein N)